MKQFLMSTMPSNHYGRTDGPSLNEEKLHFRKAHTASWCAQIF